MIKLHTSESIFYIKHLENILNLNGIDCLIKNEYLSGGLGEIPFIECLPELWLIDESKLEYSKKIILENNMINKVNSEWLCEICNENNDPQFLICWSCETTKEYEE
ncbi:MAG: DUF2007 domain-containing protein [Pseudomonadota bacterium]|nr:hypothetical protein [Gammaproteobacteria bacterium]MEE2684227.1 DUF2007 domain-containing protein [Pseudomonadota bacterium]|tara:strand:- start:5820 stop:6137 length:318 start_codon:yes stop_codon:yes gene_type:complete